MLVELEVAMELNCSTRVESVEHAKRDVELEFLTIESKWQEELAVSNHRLVTCTKSKNDLLDELALETDRSALLDEKVIFLKGM